MLVVAKPHSKWPLTSPHSDAARGGCEGADRVVAVRRRFPTWGAEDAVATAHRSYESWPAASTIGRILNAHHLTKPSQEAPREGSAIHAAAAKCTMPNTTWSVDFKMYFKIENGEVS